MKFSRTWFGRAFNLLAKSVTIAWTLVGLTGAPTTNDFSGRLGLTPYATKTWGTYAGSLVANGSLRMTYANGQSCLVAFDRTSEGPARKITADFSFSATAGADGFSFSLLNTTTYGTDGISTLGQSSAAPTPWEEPELSQALSVGFDIYDPDDYQGLGAHEISLHWNGVELAKRLSPVDFRTGAFIPLHIEISFVPGGAELTVVVGGTTVYAQEFIAGPVPFESRVAFGARTGGLSFTSLLDNVQVTFDDSYVAFPQVQAVSTFSKVWINGGNRAPQKTVSLPIPTRPWERVVAKVQLDAPPNGFDVYDRQMNLSVTAGGKTVEIARFITPFGRRGGPGAGPADGHRARVIAQC